MELLNPLEKSPKPVGNLIVGKLNLVYHTCVSTVYRRTFVSVRWGPACPAKQRIKSLKQTLLRQTSRPVEVSADLSASAGGLGWGLWITDRWSTLILRHLGVSLNW